MGIVDERPTEQGFVELESTTGVPLEDLQVMHLCVISFSLPGIKQEDVLCFWHGNLCN